jgi:hypothetical protein
MAGVIDRYLTWKQHPILNALGDYLAQLTGCTQHFKKGVWLAYSLKDSEILTPIPGLLSDSKGPAKFAEFTVTVDSNRLSDFRARMARRFRKRPIQEPAAAA